jgi:uncharacterized damage-inducible protein DinB
LNPNGATEPVSSNAETPGVAEAFIDRARRFLSAEYLPKIELCLEQLTDEQIWSRPNDISNSIGNLILHICGNARQWIVSGLGSKPDQRERDGEFSQRNIIARADLLSGLRTTIDEVDSVLANLNSESLLESRTIQGKKVDVLEAVFHVTEHFSMHTGQIILLTKFLAQKDLGFYDFSTGAPVNRWH